MIYYIYIMSDEFDFFSNDCNNWNYNEFINTPNAYREGVWDWLLVVLNAVSVLT